MSEVLNTTQELSQEMKTYYEKRLIDNAEPHLVHDQFGDHYPIPANGGKSIEFRKYSPLDKAMEPLTEGVTPNGSRLEVSTVTAELAQYGDYIRMSDMLEMTAIDRNVEQALKLLGSQAGRTLDTVTREVLCGGSQKLFAPVVADGEVTQISARSSIVPEARMTPDMVFRAVAELRAQNANPIDDCYAAIIHPYVAYDLMRSEEWIDVNKYANPEQIYRGEVGKIGQVRFILSTDAKVIAPNAVAGIANMNRTQVQEAVNSATTVRIADNINAVQAATANAAITGGAEYPVYVNGILTRVMSVKAGANGTAELTLADAVTAAKGDMVCGDGAGAYGAAVFLTLFLGANAYGTTDLEGGGLQQIIKPLGYGEDPLNQRSSVGWKAAKTAERLVEAYMIRVESGSEYSMTALSN